MEPKSLSATGLQTYMECPARFKAEYIDRVRVNLPGGTAGDMGSLIHAVLEWFVTESMAGNEPEEKALASKTKELAPYHGVDALQIKVAIKMIDSWYDRWVKAATEEKAFEPIMTEVKESFTLHVKDWSGKPHMTQVTYIWDRADRLLDDGSIRVVDYKSWMKCLTADEIFHYLQFRVYALAAAIRFKADHPPFIWVQADQLRYGMGTAVRFSRDDITEIWGWLRGVYARILEDSGETENVGPGCRFCVRSSSCESFARTVQAGTIMSYQEPEDAARKVAEINAVMGALQDTKAALLSYLETYLEERGYLEERFEGTGVTLKITPKRKRTVNQEDAVRAVGTEIASRYGKLGVGVIDDLLAGDELSEQEKEELRRAIDEGMETSVNAFFK